MMQSRKVNVMPSSIAPQGVKKPLKASVVTNEKRRLSARLAAKQLNIDKENVPQTKSVYTVKRATTTVLTAKPQTAAASTSKKPVVVKETPIQNSVLQNYRVEREKLRLQLVEQNPSLLKVEAKTIFPNLPTVYELHYVVGDNLEKQMSPELLMEPFSIHIFDHLREMEIECLDSNLNADLITASMTPPFKPTGTSLLSAAFRSKLAPQTSTLSIDPDKRISVRMRYMLVNWLAEVHEHLDMMPETLFMAVALLDLYIAREASRISRDVLQLLGLACLQVAAKYEEMVPPAASDLATIADNSYTVAQINEYERKIVSLLKFKITFPVPITFFRRFSRLMVATDKEHCMAKYFAELSVMDLPLACTSPSLRAAAALALARMLFRMSAQSSAGVKYGSGEGEASLTALLDEIWTAHLQFHSGYVPKQLIPVIRNLVSMVERHNITSPLRAIRNKYSRQEFGAISSDPLLKCGHLELILIHLNG